MTILILQMFVMYILLFFFLFFRRDLSNNQLTAVGKRTLRGLNALRNL